MKDLTSLTPREREMVHHVLKGLSNKAIAESLGVTTNTVKTHLKNVFAKLEMKSRQELIVNQLS